MKILKTNQYYLFIYFDSTCIYCKNEIEIIHTNKSQIKNVEIFFISNEEVETIKEFSKKFNFEGNHNIRFTHDINLGFYKKYNIIITPTLFFYNKDAILVKVQKGPITFKQFQDIINIEF
ncbi:thioredoxin fold domain-containing protein [Myroides odoratus]|uniref:peroxiredoxin family protein n=1 Tax=Myroides odoratus TaxID=256 RepID=UPI00333EB7EF